VSKKQTSKSSVAKIATTPSSARESTPSRVLPLGFSSLPGFCAFALFAIVLFIAPYLFSGFWPSSYEYWPQAMFLALISCVCVLWALAEESQIANSQIGKSKSKVGVLLALFLACCAISFSGTVYLHDSLLEFSRVVGVLACFFLARSFLLQHETFPSRAAWILAAFLAGGVLVCVPSILDFLQTRNPRQFGTFYNPNLFANYCAMAIPLAAAGVLLLRRNARGKAPMISGIVVLAIIALGLVVTSSKGGFLAALCGSLIFVLAIFRAKGERVRGVLRANKIAFAVSVLLILGIGALVFSQMILPRLSSNIQNDHSTMFRVYTWAGTWRMAIDRPLFGWGAGSFPSAYPQFAETGYTRSAHQSWLQIAAECGFPAMLFLLAACVVAFANGWKALRGNAWPIAAGSLGALVAFCVHGLTDSGWNIVSIGVLLMAVLALLETANAQTSEISTEVSAPKSQINWRWLLATLPLALGSWVSQRAQTGEDLRLESRELMGRGAASTALKKAREARIADLFSARLLDNFAQAKRVASKQIPSSNDDWMYQKIIEMQPTRALNYLHYAEYLIERKGSKDRIGHLYEEAIRLDPNDTEIRISRGNWLGKDGWRDFRKVVGSAQKPFGKYPATPEMVDLNFARAYLSLAQSDFVEDKAYKKSLVEAGLKVIAEGRKWETQRREMEQAAQGGVDESREQTMDELEEQLKKLRAQLSPSVGASSKRENS